MDFTHSHRQLLLQHSSVGFVEPPSKVASHADPRARLLQLVSLDKHASTPRLPPFVGPSSYACPLTQAAVGALLKCNS